MQKTNIHAKKPQFSKNIFQSDFSEKGINEKSDA